MADHQIFAPTGFSIVDAAAAKVVSNAKYADGRYCELHFQRGKQVRLSIYNSHTVCNSCLEFLTEEAGIARGAAWLRNRLVPGLGYQHPEAVHPAW